MALLFIQNAMADCKIKNQPSEELKAYIKDFETMMKNISSYSAPKKERSIYDFWVGLYNEAFQFENFTTKFDFFTDFIKTQELPKEVIRDYNKLKNEDNYLRETTKYVSNNNLSQVKVKNICAGICYRRELMIGSFQRNKDFSFAKALSRNFEIDFSCFSF